MCKWTVFIYAVLALALFGCNLPKTDASATRPRLIEGRTDIALSGDCVSRASGASRASNVFSCAKFASLRIRTSDVSTRAWLTRAGANYFDAALRDTDPAFVTVNTFARSMGRFFDVEVAVFYGDDASNESMLAALGSRAHELADDSPVARTFSWIDYSFLVRDVGVESRALGEFEVPNDIDHGVFFTSGLGASGFPKTRAADYWLKVVTLLKSLRSAGPVSEWEKALKEFEAQNVLGTRIQWDVLRSSPAENARFGVSYFWDSKQPGDQDEWYTAEMIWPSEWMFEAPARPTQ